MSCSELPIGKDPACVLIESHLSDLMRSVETYEAEHLAGIHDENFQLPPHSNIHDK